jgi:hypothetical protein
MIPSETTIVQNLITKTQSGALKWRLEKDSHYVTTNAPNNMRIEIMDIKTGILPVHIFENDSHTDTISLDDVSMSITLLNLIIGGRTARMTRLAGLI